MDGSLIRLLGTSPPLGHFTLILDGNQICWISRTLRQGDLARPMNEGESRQALERIWAKSQERQ